MCKNKTIQNFNMCSFVLHFSRILSCFLFSPRSLYWTCCITENDTTDLTQDPSLHTITHKAKCVNLRWWMADTDIHLGKDSQIVRELKRKWRRWDKAEICCICEAYSEEKTDMTTMLTVIELDQQQIRLVHKMMGKLIRCSRKTAEMFL